MPRAERRELPSPICAYLIPIAPSFLPSFLPPSHGLAAATSALTKLLFHLLLPRTSTIVAQWKVDENIQHFKGKKEPEMILLLLLLLLLLFRPPARASHLLRLTPGRRPSDSIQAAREERSEQCGISRPSFHTGNDVCHFSLPRLVCSGHGGASAGHSLSLSKSVLNALLPSLPRRCLSHKR